jgi:hypothetical protein
MDFPVNQKEELERWDWEIKNNIVTPLDYMASENPEMTEDELLEQYNKNKALNKQLTPMQAAFKNEFDKLNDKPNDNNPVAFRPDKKIDNAEKL